VYITLRVCYKYDDGTVLGEFAGVTGVDGDHEALQTRVRVRLGRVQNKNQKKTQKRGHIPPHLTHSSHPPTPPPFSRRHPARTHHIIIAFITYIYIHTHTLLLLQYLMHNIYMYNTHCIIMNIERSRKRVILYYYGLLIVGRAA